MNLASQLEIMTSSFASAMLMKTSHFNIIFLYLSNDYDKQIVTEEIRWTKSRVMDAI